jgi:hypothetical protein
VARMRAVCIPSNKEGSQIDSKSRESGMDVCAYTCILLHSTTNLGVRIGNYFEDTPPPHTHTIPPPSMLILL